MTSPREGPEAAAHRLRASAEQPGRFHTSPSPAAHHFHRLRATSVTDTSSPADAFDWSVPVRGSEIWLGGGGGGEAGTSKRPKRMFRPFEIIWRQPTLAEPIEPLPSARLCLTAVFGMGTGRTTALWPPRNSKKNECSLKIAHRSQLRD